jgi:hypothetical protein
MCGQSYLQKLLKQALRTLGYTEQAERATHFSYEMVALSNAAARALGYLAPDAPDDKRGFVDVSGRKGQGVKGRRPAGHPASRAPKPKSPGAIQSLPPRNIGASPI